MILCPDQYCKHNTLKGKEPKYNVKAQTYLPVGKCRKRNIELRWRAEDDGLYCDNRIGLHCK